MNIWIFQIIWSLQPSCKVGIIFSSIWKVRILRHRAMKWLGPDDTAEIQALYPKTLLLPLCYGEHTATFLLRTKELFPAFVVTIREVAVGQLIPWDVSVILELQLFEAQLHFICSVKSSPGPHHHRHSFMSKPWSLCCGHCLHICGQQTCLSNGILFMKMVATVAFVHCWILRTSPSTRTL